ncbi:MAG: ribonuclease HI family protein [Candidatus Berkelbacteria bacterium]|nr:ribonuclease HI family protein [Candidatus Berkelbacteria bacterium]
MDKVLIFCDGGARGNPGPAAIGVVIKSPDGKTVKEISRKIGRATNNVAEYKAVLAALGWILENQPANIIEFYLDSELVTRQLNGQYKVKDTDLKPLYYKIRELVFSSGRAVIFKHVRREENLEADRLVNEELDRA